MLRVRAQDADVHRIWLHYDPGQIIGGDSGSFRVRLLPKDLNTSECQYKQIYNIYDFN